MPDIFHRFPIYASSQRIFEAVSAPQQLDQWWTKDSAGSPQPGQPYTLEFGPSYRWLAIVSKAQPNKEFEFTMQECDPDWVGTKVGFTLKAESDATLVEFHHTGWPQANDHYRTSCFCWAMYLRLLKRYIEFGQVSIYEDRLDA